MDQPVHVIAVLLTLLCLKHWFVDFYRQTGEQIRLKGQYGNLVGIQHSIEHAVGTLVCLALTKAVLGLSVGYGWCWVLAFADYVIHYHLDYIKSNYGCQDQGKKEFWNHLGLDQMAHHITYVVIAAIAVG